MALENLTPVVRVEEILNGDNVAPATRLEYFLKKASESSGGGGAEPLLVGTTFVDNVITLDKTYKQIRDAILAGSSVVIQMPNVDYSGGWFANGLAFITQIYYVAESQYYCINITGDVFAYNALWTTTETGYPSLDLGAV